MLFRYNAFNHSNGFIFDPSIEKVWYKGREIILGKFYDELSKLNGKESFENQFIVYFELFQKVLQFEIDPLFRHKGRIEDYYSWEKEISNLNLQKSVYEEDVLGKLDELQKKRYKK